MFDYYEVMEIEQELTAMELDSSYSTVSSYSANAELYPSHRLSFIEKHMAYIKSHPQINPHHYLSNLRLRVKKRT